MYTTIVFTDKRMMIKNQCLTVLKGEKGGRLCDALKPVMQKETAV